jgi:hypothetical protein
MIALADNSDTIEPDFGFALKIDPAGYFIVEPM